MIVTVVSIALAVLGVLAAVYFGLETRKSVREARRLLLENRGLEKRIHRFGWNDIESGCKYLASLIEPEFKPDLVLCSSPGSVGIVANLYLTYIDRFVPLYIGVSKKRGTNFPSEPIYTDRYETDRWVTYLPSDLQSSRATKILILEDVVITGQTMSAIVGRLEDQGFERESQIKTAALFCSDLATLQGARPDFCWMNVEDTTSFELPWGRSTGKGF